MLPVLLCFSLSPLANARVYIVRHAEKTEDGPGLTSAGVARAKAYADYFRHDPLDGSTLRLSHIFAAKDSKKSMRPRLTVEPIARSLGQKVDVRFENKHPDRLAKALRSEHLGKRILICWHHGALPKLLAALGADPSRFVPEGQWPESVYDRVVELRFDKQGNLDVTHSQTIPEHLMPVDATVR